MAAPGVDAMECGLDRLEEADRQIADLHQLRTTVADLHAAATTARQDRRTRDDRRYP